MERFHSNNWHKTTLCALRQREQEKSNWKRIEKWTWRNKKRKCKKFHFSPQRCRRCYLSLAIFTYLYLSLFLSFYFPCPSTPNRHYKLGGSSPECWLADSHGISDRIPRVWQNTYFYCSNYVGNHFIMAIRHLVCLRYMANIPRLRAVSRHFVVCCA